ncbi:MAG: SpoIID/LytB domain-containing protein [Muribaculaceae bacterium]|nr:SpoIID/LytB domain-containing protein [Muribaculaceae bacterium]
MKISIGIMTDGEPIFKNIGDYNILQNQLIGCGFHWQRTISSKLPGVLHPTGDSEFPLVNTIDIETYLECVVGSEMNPDAPLEFLKTHSIISRSWAVGKVLGCHAHSNEGKILSDDELRTWEDTADHIGFDVCSDDHCQRYQGIQPLTDKAKEAIRATSGLIIADADGNPVDARFSKCCGGRTETFDTCWQDIHPASIESVKDPWCDVTALDVKERDAFLQTVLKDYDRSTEGGYRWRAVVSATEIEEYLQSKFGINIGHIINLIPLERGASGRIKRLLFKGDKGDVIIGKELMIRKALAPTHLYSSWFDIERPSHDMFILNGRGWGHGVGLCQVGAARMAQAGHSAEEILHFYYPGCRIERMEESDEITDNER